MAGLKAARWLGEVAVKAESYDSEFYHWPTAAERANQYPDLPKVVAYVQLHGTGTAARYLLLRPGCQAAGTYRCSPTEFFDGAIISGNCVSPGSKTTTYHHPEQRRHQGPVGQAWQELNFVGIILNP